MDKVQSVHGLPGLCPWTLSRSLDSFQSAWTPWTLSNVHGQSPDCPSSPWTLSMVSLNFVHGLTGLFPVSLDIVQTVHWVHGKSPLSSWTPWTLSMDSLDSLQKGILMLLTFWMVLWWHTVFLYGNYIFMLVCSVIVSLSHNEGKRVLFLCH